MKHTKKIAIVALLASPFLSVRAYAQEMPVVVNSVEASYVGLAVGFIPDYVGSDDYTYGIAPAFRYQFDEQRFVELTANYLDANILNSSTWRFGPAFRYRFGRDGDVDDLVVKNMSDIDDTIEGGVTAYGTWILGNDPRHRVTAGADALWDLGDASGGYSSNVFARYWAPVSRAIDVGVAGNFQYSDENFNDTYFGVSAADSTASGLPTFNADSGVTSYSIMPMAMIHLSREWHVGVGFRYQKLAGDAADSPIVEDRGDDSQWVGGIGLVYSWDLGTN